MRFRQIDKIVEWRAGERMVATKTLAASEDYLRDHFPNFPVMPGVLMLEAMFQTSAWLLYVTEDFANSMVILKETRNVRFADFVEPGETLVVTAELLSHENQTAKLKAQGMVGDSVAVSGRLVLESYRIGERYPQRAGSDILVRRDMKKLFQELSAGDGAG